MKSNFYGLIAWIANTTNTLTDGSLYSLSNSLKHYSNFEESPEALESKSVTNLTDPEQEAMDEYLKIAKEENEIVGRLITDIKRVIAIRVERIKLANVLLNLKKIRSKEQNQEL